MDTNKIINELPKLFDRATKDFELWNKKLFETNDTRWRLETFPEELKKFRNSFEYHIGKKYEFLDKIFLNVLRRHPDKLQKIFFVKVIELK